MKYLNDLLQNLGISKVKLAKYLGVSRQMVYNYLTLDSIDKWPKEKKILLLQLLDLDELTPESVKKIKLTANYMMDVDNKLNHHVTNNNSDTEIIDYKGLSKENKVLLNDITYLLRDKLEENKNKKNINEVKYLFYFLQSIDNVPEIDYILGYFAKSNGFIDVNEYSFNKDKQYLFEAILFSAVTLYNSGGASKSKIEIKHKDFERDIESKREEVLSRTEQINTYRIQALKELGYTDITSENYAEFIEKYEEIKSRRL